MFSSGQWPNEVIDMHVHASSAEILNTAKHGYGEQEHWIDLVAGQVS